MGQAIEQAVFTAKSALDPNMATTRFAVFNPDGSPRVMAAQAAAQTDAPALTSAAATGGEPPTEAEYNALRTDVSNLRGVVNSLLAKLRTAEVIDT